MFPFLLLILSFCFTHSHVFCLFVLSCFVFVFVMVACQSKTMAYHTVILVLKLQPITSHVSQCGSRQTPPANCGHVQNITFNNQLMVKL